MRLALYRGDAPDRYVDLPEGDVRIGRAHENDVVLEDPGKAVSRFHAELRHEHGRYVIVDLNSQNGVWIAERRVTREPLEPGVAVTIGPYRLVLDLPPDEVTYAGQDQEFASATRLADPLPAQPLPQVPPAPAPRRSDGRRVRALATLAAAVVLATVVAAVVVSRRTTPPPAPPPQAPQGQETVDTQVQQHLREAQNRLERNDPEGALTEIDAALRLKPADEQAVQLRAKAEAARQPPPPPDGPVPSPVVKPAASVEKPSVDPTLKDPTDLPRKAGESRKDWRSRDERVSRQYAEGKNALDRGDLTAGIRVLQGIQSENPGYRDVAALLARARERERDAIHEGLLKRLSDAQQSERSGDLAAALQQFQRVHDADASIAEADDGIKRVQAAIASAVEITYRDAKQDEAFKATAKAIEGYERVLKLLPEGDPRRAYAEQHLKILRSNR